MPFIFNKIYSTFGTNHLVRSRLRAQTLSYSEVFYRRLRSRLGPPKAITATAHKLAQLFYRLWKTAGEYTDPGANYYEQQYQQRMLKSVDLRLDINCGRE